MKTIWVLDDGMYSDYHVIEVFSSKRNAELVQSKVGGEVAEWPLDPVILVIVVKCSMMGQ